MSIRMVGAEMSGKTAASLTFRPNAAQESKRAASEAGGGVNQLATAGHESQEDRLGKRYDHHVRTDEGNKENRVHGGSAANWLGVLFDIILGRTVEGPLYTGPKAAAGSPGAAGQPADPAVVPGPMDTTK